MSETETESLIVIERMSVDQFAGAVVLILGAVGSLLLVIWQSRCACKCRIGLSDHCYLFDCSREPPPESQIDKLKKEKEQKEKAKEATQGEKDLKKVDKSEFKSMSRESSNLSLETESQPEHDQRLIP